MDALGIPSLVTQCNLANGRVAHVPVWQPFLNSNHAMLMSSSALFPKGTDIRDLSCAGAADVVEIPAGTGRFYWVTFCDDIGKGFTNEHRWAVIQKVWTYGAWAIYRWPVPMP